MVMFKNREFRIIFDEEGKLKFENPDGSEVTLLERAMLRVQIQDNLEHKLSLYIAAGWTTERVGQYKIGVSNDPIRRADELNAAMMHWVNCSGSRVWKLEREVHKFFRYWRTDGEWFRFNDEVGETYYNKFLTLKSEHDIRIFLRERLPYEYISRRISEEAERKRKASE